MSAVPVAQLLSDPRFKGKPITWGVTPEGYDAVRRAWLTTFMLKRCCSSRSQRMSSTRR
jgi:hypothetical protein